MNYPKALLVMSKEMQREFSPAVSNAQVEWIGVETCDQARVALAEHPNTAVVISDQTLPDGNWFCLFDELVKRDLRANLVVVVPGECDTSVIESYGVFGVLRSPIKGSASEVIATAAHPTRNLAQAG
jgi:DNA-binding NtrC family response regulator